MGNYTYFSDSEIVGLDPELVAMLDRARHRADTPFFITDGLRTPATNTDANAVQDSAHLKGLAVDLRCHDSHTLWKMIDGLMFAGFKRIGIYVKTVDGKTGCTHIHVDTDQDKPWEVIFLAQEK